VQLLAVRLELMQAAILDVPNPVHASISEQMAHATQPHVHEKTTTSGGNPLVSYFGRRLS
jgi:hypothetical protein